MRRAVLAASVAVLSLMIGAGAVVAWACTPQPRSFAVTPAAAAAGSVASVVGQGVPAGSPVQVRWDDLQGRIIGSSTADERGQFQTSVTIPEGQPGVHAVVFSAGEPGQPSVVGVGRLAFKLSSPDGRALQPALDPWSSSGPTPNTQAAAARTMTTGFGILGLGLAVLAGASTLTVVGGRRRSRASAA